MSKRTQKILTFVLMVMVVLTLRFIFSNSMESIPESREKSDGILALLTPLLELFVGKGNVTERLVRKLAHFVEFFALGAELCALCLLHTKPLLWAMFTGLLAALSDETIQIFYARGSQVQDVWLDFSAVAVTGILAVVLRVLYLRVKKERA